jgi:hypothetical protein
MKTFKALLLTLFLSVLQISTYCQNNNPSVSNDEWNKLIEQLTNENWTKAEKLCLKYLDKFSEKNDTLDDAAIVRYMYLRCIGAKLGEKTYTKEQALKKMNKQIGKPIITPPKSFLMNGMFNCFKVAENNKDLFSCSSNNQMTIIQIFETYKLADTTIISNPSELEGKKIRVGGIIKIVEAGGMMMPRLDIIIEKAFVWNSED